VSKAASAFAFKLRRDTQGVLAEAYQLVRRPREISSAFHGTGMLKCLPKKQFPGQKRGIFCKVKEIKGLGGGVHLVRRTTNLADRQRKRAVSDPETSLYPF
jgi:hypothetical protein